MKTEDVEVHVDRADDSYYIWDDHNCVYAEVDLTRETAIEWLVDHGHATAEAAAALVDAAEPAMGWCDSCGDYHR
jgi:hypothetical protein